MAAEDGEFHLPDLSITDRLLERVQFSVSSRNAESRVCETVTHVFGSPMVITPRSIDWKYITTGIVALLRDKEMVKKKLVWTLNLCIYNIEYSVLVWKGRIPMDCNYTVVSDNFHVLALEDGSGILGIMFQNTDIAHNFQLTVSSWIAEGLRDERGKAPPAPAKVKFRKEMISKPCNFQHIQGSQAIDECLEIERIKGHIIASLASLRLRDATNSGSFSKARQSKSKKKDPPKSFPPFKEFEVPAASVESPTRVPSDHTPTDHTHQTLPNGSGPDYHFQTTPPLVQTTPPLVHPYLSPPSLGSDNSQGSSHLGRLSPLNLEAEITSSFAFTSPSGLPPPTSLTHPVSSTS